MSDIIGIGASVYDTVMQTDRFPKEDTKLETKATLAFGGGPCATALCAASTLGASTAYLGCLGDDAYGQFMLEDFKRFGVDTSGVHIKPNCVSFHSFVLLNTASATRTCLWNKGSVPALLPEEVDVLAVRHAKILHLDGHQLDAARHAAKIAKKAGVKVSLDAGGVYPGIDQLLPDVDFLIPSEEFAQAFTGKSNTQDAVKSLYDRFRPEFVIATQGAKGGIIYDGSEFCHYPAFLVNAVDTNGAGDVFHGAFCAAYTKGMRLLSCAQFASAVSALKCTKTGARTGVPTYQETIEFLNQEGIVV